MILDIWKILEAEDELTHCKKCKKKIWKYWHVDSNKISGEMEICGPCLNKSRKKVR